MKIITSNIIEELVNNDKINATKELPYIIYNLIKDTIKDVTLNDIPFGDDISQPGFDGIVAFEGNNEYLGDKPCRIEMGIDLDYINKANKDIKKRENEIDENCNFIFITPRRWNSSKLTKSKWIEDKKEEYNWNDIRIIDGEVLSKWINDDFKMTKYIFSKLGIIADNIYNIQDKEIEFKRKNKSDKIDLSFFDYGDDDYKQLLSNLENNFYNVSALTKEEALYVTLFYLKELGFNDRVIIVEDEKEWKELIKNNILHNLYLIPYFTHEEELECPDDNVCILLHSYDEEGIKNDYKIEQRKVSNLSNALQKIIIDKRNEIDYDKINKIIRNTLCKFPALKRELFKDKIIPKWYKANARDKKILLYLFYINSFTENDINIFEKFGVDISELKEKIYDLYKCSNQFIVFYNAWNEYKIINTYDVIEALGDLIDENNLNIFCSIVKDVLYDIEPIYFPENIGKDFVIEKDYKRKYSKIMKHAIIRSFIITKLYLKKHNKINLCNKMDKIIEEYYNSINSESEFLNFASNAKELIEFDYNLFLDKIDNSLSNENFCKMFNIGERDTFFSNFEYVKILFGIEKLVYKKDHICRGIDTLVELCKIKDSNYGNMANTPFNSLTNIFNGYYNLTCLNKEDKIAILNKIINEDYDLGKKLLLSILPKDIPIICYDYNKLEFDMNDDIIPIKYVDEQIDYFKKYYKLYLDNFVKTLNDLLPLYNNLIFINYDCINDVINKTLELLKTASDNDKKELNEIITKRIYRYEKHHNNSWNLTEKQYNYLIYIKNNITFENKINEYYYLYKYNNYSISEDDIIEKKNELFNLLKNNNETIMTFFDNCEDKHLFLEDAYYYIYEKKYNVEFMIKLLSNNEKNYAIRYCKLIYKDEGVNTIINLYNELDSRDVENKVLVLSYVGYDNKLYSIVKETIYEKEYWKNIPVNDKEEHFVFDKCLEFGNIKFCLFWLNLKENLYEEKCKMLEKIKETNYVPTVPDSFDINNIFNSFANCNNKKIINQIATLELYFNNILDNKTYYFSKVASNNLSVVAELVQLIYKDDNGKKAKNINDDIVYNYYKILSTLKIDFKNNNYMKWCEDFLDSCNKLNRKKVKFSILGRLLARVDVDDEDGIFPIKNVREIIEKYGESIDLVRSFKIDVYNQRGVHNMDDGEGEMQLYEKYKSYSNKLKITYPKTSKILKKIADEYKAESLTLKEESRYVE